MSELTVDININASRDAVWHVITDIEQAAKHISAIELVEILEVPASGLVGLTWRETRTMFGRQATETMQITKCVDEEFYEAQAENHGAIYTSTLKLSEVDDHVKLSMRFKAEARNVTAKIMSATLGRLFSNATKKALQQDLVDIKQAAEALQKGA